MLTTFDADEYVYDAMKAGASGFLLKNAPPAQLVAAVRATAAGEAQLAPAIVQRMVEEFVRRPQPGTTRPQALDDLTEREVDVLKLLAKALSNAEIAAELFLIEATVRTHVSRLLAKLGLRDRTQAVVVAYETGLVQPGETASRS
jgi:DNA-binding NarL/FixJ family response regulator